MAWLEVRSGHVSAGTPLREDDDSSLEHHNDAGLNIDTASHLKNCRDWQKIGARVDNIEPALPEPEYENESLEDVSERMYTNINARWQTRILRLFPGHVGSALQGDLVVADIVMLSGLVLHKDELHISYGALSYAWGEPIRTRRIQLQGENFPITENLYSALQAARKLAEPIFLWVDAICINQADVNERSQQVVNMLELYHKASHVYVWLGPHSENTQVAFEILRAKTGTEPLHFYQCQCCLDRLLEGISEIFARPWFRRVWVKQEMYAAKQSTFLCGWSADTGDFLSAATEVLSNLRMTLSTSQTQTTADGTLLMRGATEEVYVHLRASQLAMMSRCLQMLQSFRRASLEELISRNLSEKKNTSPAADYGHALDIVSVMRRCRASECSDPRDHVYALLGMTDMEYETDDTLIESGRTLVVDYKKGVVQVFQELTRHIIRRDQNLQILHLDTSYGPFTSNSENIDLPSWVPDLRFGDLRHSWVQALHSMQVRGKIGRTPEEELREEWFRRGFGEFDGFDHPPIMDLGPDNLSANQLCLEGVYIGSIAIGNRVEAADDFQVSTGLDAWNIFHEGHVRQTGYHANPLHDVSVRMLMVADPALRSILAAINKSLESNHEFPNNDESPNPDWIQMNLINAQNLEPIGTVLLSLSYPFLEDIMSGTTFAKIILQPQESIIGRCSCSDHLFLGLKEMEDGLPYPRRYDFPSSWIVPSSAQSDDIIVMAVGSPLPLLLRPRPSLDTFELVGQAMPCQMTSRDSLPNETLSRLHVFVRRDSQDLESFILE